MDERNFLIKQTFSKVRENDWNEGFKGSKKSNIKIFFVSKCSQNVLRMARELPLGKQDRYKKNEFNDETSNNSRKKGIQ